MSELNRTDVLNALERGLKAASWRQVNDPSRPDDGALINPELGIDDPSHVGTVPFIVGSAYLYLANSGGEWSPKIPSDPGDLLKRAIAAAGYLLRVQRPSGLIDLRSCNYDSSPDTGFAVQQLCTAVELGRPYAARDAALAALLERLERFIRKAAEGMLTGGFHTPNHRWVIVSALAQTKRLCPDIDIEPVMKAYLAEGFDIDAEGAFIERSAGIYDAVSDRSLLLLDENWGVPGARAATVANLRLNLHLFHADGTVETGLSRRQDHGRSFVPLCLAMPYLYSAATNPNPSFVATARMLWERADDPSLVDLSWLSYALLKRGDPEPSPLSPPDDYGYHLPHNGLWRVRRGLLSASFYRNRTRLLALRYGGAELSSVKIHQSFFGIGRFVGDRLDVQEGTVTFHSTGRSYPRRPGYDLPLGRPVPPEAWDELADTRSYRPLPPLGSTLTVHEVGDGFDLEYRSEEGIDGVMTQIAFDFPPGGVWETADTILKPAAGQIIFLKGGVGTMRYGQDAIEIGPGAHAHTAWQMRDAEDAPQHVRVLFTLVTPIDHLFSIRFWRGLRPNKASPR